MIPSKVNYHKPENVGDAVALLQKLGDDCKILAGGHSLIPVMKLRLNDPAHLVDITGISELKAIRDNEKSITIGACATHADIANNEALQKHAPLIAKAANMIGDRQVRNFGTIGGSIAHADPAADWPAVLLASDANVNIQGKNGRRTVDIDQFFKGFYETALGEGEIITGISIPKTAFNSNSTYVKFKQPASRFAIVGVAAAADMDGGVVRSVRIGVTGVGEYAYRAMDVEKALAGKALNAENIDAALAGATNGVDVMGDHYASVKYRSHLAKVYIKRALMKLA